MHPIHHLHISARRGWTDHDDLSATCLQERREREEKEKREREEAKAAANKEPQPGGGYKKHQQKDIYGRSVAGGEEFAILKVPACCFQICDYKLRHTVRFSI